VTDGRVSYALPHPGTLGLGFVVEHPEKFGDGNGPNVAVLAPRNVGPGSAVGASDIMGIGAVGVCWSGTVDDTAMLSLVADPFGDDTAEGGLRIWADPAAAVLPVTVAPASDGTVEEPALTSCSTSVAGIG
jgi:hypothetical protein